MMPASNLAPDILNAIHRQARSPGTDRAYEQRDEIILLLREIVRRLPEPAPPDLPSNDGRKQT